MAISITFIVFPAISLLTTVSVTLFRETASSVCQSFYSTYLTADVPLQSCLKCKNRIMVPALFLILYFFTQLCLDIYLDLIIFAVTLYNMYMQHKLPYSNTFFIVINDYVMIISKYFCIKIKLLDLRIHKYLKSLVATTKWLFKKTTLQVAMNESACFRNFTQLNIISISHLANLMRGTIYILTLFQQMKVSIFSCLFFFSYYFFMYFCYFYLICHFITSHFGYCRDKVSGYSANIFSQLFKICLYYVLSLYIFKFLSPVKSVIILLYCPRFYLLIFLIQEGLCLGQVYKI